MNRENVSAIINSIEMLLNSLKMELNSENDEVVFEAVHPIENDDDIEYYEED